jgi:hypothetical protein
MKLMYCDVITDRTVGSYSRQIYFTPVQLQLQIRLQSVILHFCIGKHWSSTIRNICPSISFPFCLPVCLCVTHNCFTGIQPSTVRLLLVIHTDHCSSSSRVSTACTDISTLAWNHRLHNALLQHLTLAVSFITN